MRRTRIRGPLANHVAKMVVRGVFQGHIAATDKGKGRAYGELAQALNGVLAASGLEFRPLTLNDIKIAGNRRRAPWDPHSVPDAPDLRGLVQSLAAALSADAKTAEGLLFEEEEGSLGCRANVLAVSALAKAFLHAGSGGIPGYSDLFREGLRYDEITLRRALDDGNATRDLLGRAKAEPFEPHTVPRSARGYLLSLLKRVGVKDEGRRKECAALLLAAGPGAKDRDLRGTACARAFAAAVAHGLVHRPRWLRNEEIIERLRSFGVTKTSFYQAKRDRFQARCVPNTTANRLQVQAMARALSLDPGPVLELILERR